MREAVIRIHSEDNVAVAVEGLKAGQRLHVSHAAYTAKQDIPAGHKVALADIPAGEPVVKYGYTIGWASADIRRGCWVHSANLETALDGMRDWQYAPTPTVRPAPTEATFQGYARSNGDVGIRNEIWIVNTVGCVNKTAERIAAAAHGSRDAGVDGVYSFPHPFGCSQLGDDLLNTQKILAGLVNHPNAAAVLVLGLGCENNYIGAFRKAIGPCDPDRVLFLNAQDAEDEVEAGLDNIRRLSSYVAQFRRSAQPLGKLKVGLKCGGSDAFSGITANPLLGMFSDWLVAAGGSVLMSEVPEMFGAERALLNRCADRSVFRRAAAMIEEFQQYYLAHGQPIYENPSPGNKDGGITTLEEKSLGCVQKGGQAIITDVLAYGQRAALPGLNLVSGPGNDMVACTALAAAGAQVVLFTTGRGTPLGGPVPTVKVSTNSAIFRRKPHWMDFDAGRLLSGGSADSLCAQLTDLVLRVAQGQALARNEDNGYREIGIFKDGVFL